MKIFQGEPGDKLAPKLIHVISQSVIATRKGLGPHEHKLRVAAMQTVIDRAGREVADLYRPLLTEVLNRDDVHPIAREFIEKVASGEHQWQAMVGRSALGAGVGEATGGVGAFLSNELAPLTYHIVGSNPHLIPGISTIIDLGARGLIDEGTAVNSARQLGYHNGWYHELVRASYSYGAPDLAQEGARRGLLNRNEVENMLQVQGIAPGIFDLIWNTRMQLLSPADAALAVLRGNLSLNDALDIAHSNGVSTADLHTLIGNTGEPPGIMQLLEAYRRGFIDKNELERGILQSRVRNEWIPTLEKLRYAPMSTADAIEAFVQNHLTEKESRAFAQQNGLEPAAWDTLAKIAGQPISKTEVIQLLRRKVITTDRARQALREGRLKDKYIDDVLKEVKRIPEPREIGTLYSHGALNRHQAIDLLAQTGTDTELSKAILDSSVSQKLAETKHLSVSTYSELYRERAITRHDYITGLKFWGYSDREADLIAQVDDLRIHVAERNHTISRVRTEYVSHLVDQAAAKNALLAIKATAQEIVYLISVWDIDRKLNIRIPSFSEIINAWFMGFIKQDECVQRLTQMGYSTSDAKLMMSVKAKKKVV